MVKDKDLKPTGQQFKPEPYIPKTETRLVLEQQDLYPDLGYRDISEQREYGPCRNSIPNPALSLTGTAHVLCPHSKEELFRQLQEAESELRSQRQQYANELRDLKSEIINHHAWFEAIEDIRGERETGMRISSYMNLAPVGGREISLVSSTLIDAVSKNDINKAKSGELEAKSAVLRKITSLINRYGE